MNPIPLWPAPCPGDFQPYLKPFLLSGDAPRGAVIVCPGGGYGVRAGHEGDPVSRKFNALGFHAFTLEYRVAPQAHYPDIQLDALRAIQLVRFNAARWRVKSDKIAILGFSAGGHLAASTAFAFRDLTVDAGDGADAVSSRPDATVLCYAVLSGVTEPHSGSFENLLGRTGLSDRELQRFSCELQVASDTPPAFLWHTAPDQAVPVSNSINYFRALLQLGIRCSLHIYPAGPHGIGLAEEYPDAVHWPEDAARFLQGIGF